ncbi:diguanylate cyclase [Rhodanobacter sp. AS-Z3]|uniref:ligand-binding sensor domain-containing diguanylate cyclase n=1 Tax=Rhodanobacter sp. AS-Z3 TaxID=3031330 RepID=UPI002478D10B|nr:ligand-binding sensor domain-containing diguanylate cyclase [Rhodanobacter sp. AS-Z3]WEN14756.1 diguanylate cyclase [Rhodanobacter sp. AS-Z3]
MPLLKNFHPQDYAGYPQNWAVVQDQRGMVYVGNGEDGVLEFDGSHWRHIDVANQTTVRSLAVDASGKIYVGGVGELGYLAPDDLGRMKYVSLVDQLPPADRDFADVWRILITSDGVYFFTSERLLRLHAGKFRSWVPTGKFHLAFAVNDQLYVTELGVGLQQMEHDQLVLVPGGQRFADSKIYAMVAWSDSALLMGTRKDGWLIEEGGTYRPWQVEHADALNAAQVYGALWLSHDRLAIGTLQAGVLVFDRLGNETNHIDTASGLLDDTVYWMTQDREGGLWLALDNGIARVETGSALTLFAQINGLEGTPVVTHRHHGVFYAGTTKGLFRLVDTDKKPRFERVPLVAGPVWDMLDMGDVMVVAAQGIFAVTPDGTASLLAKDVGYAMVRPETAGNRVLVAQQQGLRSMRLEHGQLIADGSVGGITDESHSLRIDKAGRLWVGFVGNGAAYVSLPNNDQPLDNLPVHRFKLPDGSVGISRSLEVGMIDGEIRFAGAHGIQRFDERTGKLVPDERFEHLFGTQSMSVWNFEQDASGNVWMYVVDTVHHTKAVGAAMLDGQGRYRWDDGALHALFGKTVFDIQVDRDDVIWFSTDDGLYQYDARRMRAAAPPASSLVRKVTVHGGRVLWGGAGTPPATTLKWHENSLRFDYAQPAFDEVGKGWFQVMLEGMDDGWSEWTAESYRDYTNLPEGEYRFRVRARDAHGKLGGEGSFAFQVLPPWYRTWWAYLAFTASLALLLIGGVGWRLRALGQRNQLLMQLVDERTEALAAANAALADLAVTDALTGLKNRRYLADHIAHDVAQARRRYQQLARDGAELAAAADAPVNLLFLMLDLDHFKDVNDRYGHASGDRVLAQLSSILREAMRDSDTAVRWGGEEFLIIVRAASNGFGAVMAERIRSMVEQHAFDVGDGQTIHCTCSVGFALYPLFASLPERYGWEEVVDIADQCMYEAKRAGRNRWVGVLPTKKAVTSGDAPAKSPDLDMLCGQGYLERLAGGVEQPAV